MIYDLCFPVLYTESHNIYLGDTIGKSVTRYFISNKKDVTVYTLHENHDGHTSVMYEMLIWRKPSYD